MSSWFREDMWYRRMDVTIWDSQGNGCAREGHEGVDIGVAYERQQQPETAAS
ncbi:hypothetical protein E4U46_003579 [Claviceps purpurea]|nr:hypothetical protein E4U46_003579 [Claviceps purpurea]